MIIIIEDGFRIGDSSGDHDHNSSNNNRAWSSNVRSKWLVSIDLRVEQVHRINSDIEMRYVQSWPHECKFISRIVILYMYIYL